MHYDIYFVTSLHNMRKNSSLVLVVSLTISFISNLILYILYFTVPDFNSQHACTFRARHFVFVSFLSVFTDKNNANKGNWECKRQEAQTRLLGRVDCRRTQTTILNLAPTNPALLVYRPKSCSSIQSSYFAQITTQAVVQNFCLFVGLFCIIKKG